MLKGVHRFAWLAIWTAGCGDNLSVSTTTRTQVITSVQGDRVAYVLEPLLVGDAPTAHIYTEKGPAVLVDLDSDVQLDTFAVGMTQVVTGTTRAWVLQSSFAEWQGSTPIAEPAPRTANMAVIDRDTLHVTTQAVLDPPIDVPVAIGDELFDVSRDASPSGRLAVRVRDDQGGAQMVADELGGHPAWCTSPSHLVYAFEQASTLRILDVRRGTQKWFWTRIDLATTALGPGGIACDQVGARVAIDVDDVVQGRSVLLLDLATDHRTNLTGLVAPFAIQSDGSALIAQRAEDHRFVRVTAAGTTPIELSADNLTNPRPVVVGNQALFNTRTEFRIVDLTTGNVGPAIDIRWDGARVIPWPTAGGFAVMRYRGDELTGLGIASAGGTLAMGLPPLLRDPELLAAAGTRMYVVTSNDKRDVRQVFGFDRTMEQPVFSATPPECDPGAITRGSCR